MQVRFIFTFYRRDFFQLKSSNTNYVLSVINKMLDCGMKNNKYRTISFKIYGLWYLKNNIYVAKTRGK